MERIAILNLPSPPGMDVHRDTGGGFGTALYVSRRTHGHSSNVIFPTFIPYLATSLRRAGYEVVVIDGQAERRPLDDFVARAEREEPSAMIALLSLPSIWGDCEVLAELKRRLPQTPVVGIGPVCVPFAQEILTKTGIDLLARGFYPFYHGPILEFLRQIRLKPVHQAREIPGALFLDQTKSGPSVVDMPLTTEQGDGSLDDLDLDAYRLLPMGKYRLSAMGPRGRRTDYFPILGGKGCHFNCMYCPYPVGFGKRVVLKSPELIAREMEFLHENFGVDGFLFRDQIFTADRRRVEAICAAIMDRNLTVNWAVEARIDEVSQPLLRMMRQAGCIRIQCGVETGDAELLETIGKPGLRMTKIEENYDHIVTEGIFAVAFVLFGLPGEDMAAAKRTTDFVLRLNCDNVLCSVVTPYPGTRLWEVAQEKDLILSYDWRRYTTRHVVMRTETLSGKDLAKVQSRFMRRFRLKQVGRMLRPGAHRGVGTLSWRGAAYRLCMAHEQLLGRKT